MLTEYIEEALRYAKYEIISDDEPYYGESSLLSRILQQAGISREEWIEK